VNQPTVIFSTQTKLIGTYILRTNQTRQLRMRLSLRRHLVCGRITNGLPRCWRPTLAKTGRSGSAVGCCMTSNTLMWWVRTGPRFGKCIRSYEYQSHNRTVFCFEQAKRAIPQDTRKRNSLRGALVGTIICGQDRRRKVTVRVDGIYRGHNESWLLRRCGNSAYVETDVDDRRGLALTQTVPEAYAAGR
jgi:hypothetical protein